MQSNEIKPRTSPLPNKEEENFSDIAKYGVVDVVGDDAVGRKIIVLSACKLPSNKEVDHPRILRYLMYTLDKFVEQDYSLVYFHYGLTSENKPTFKWLWGVYRMFDRKYKKNIKKLYLVHPTGFLKLMLLLFKAITRSKFQQKITYVNHLHELENNYLHLDQLNIPPPVLNHDKELLKKFNKSVTITKSEPLPTQQFGVSLQFIKTNNDGKEIPPLVQQCVEYLSQPNVLETEGIFRKSTISPSYFKELRNRINIGEPVKFGDNVHDAAFLLKAFLRELEEPLMTSDLFDEIIQFQTLPKDERPTHVKIMLNKLPHDNYGLLKYIIQFLSKVMERCDQNRMNSSNLAIIFGPNLVRIPPSQLTYNRQLDINSFIDFILTNHLFIFV